MKRFSVSSPTLRAVLELRGNSWDMVDRKRKRWKEIKDIAATNQRPHAGHFSWETDRAVAEAGVLKEFQEALEGAGLAFFSNGRHRGSGNDPPDCEADHAMGGRVGIEITELVDASSAAAARVGQVYDAKDWRSELIPTLGTILKKKDAPATVKDPPYSEYVLLIHTDEPWLEIDSIRQSLAEHIFPATSLITRAYLLISYDPWEKGYPCIQLNIASN